MRKNLEYQKTMGVVEAGDLIEAVEVAKRLGVWVEAAIPIGGESWQRKKNTGWVKH